MSVRQFIEDHYRHFNARALRDAARDYVRFVGAGNRMMITLAGAMSTAEIGRSLAEMIRRGQVAALSCTGANLEEVIFNAIAHHDYRVLTNYRDLTPDQERDLHDQGLNRVTDTCIPEETAMRRLGAHMIAAWQQAGSRGERRLPHEYLYDVVRQPAFRDTLVIDPADSWVLAAADADLPLVVPGWEDSTLGNLLVARAIRGEVDTDCILSGLHYMHRLIDWYQEVTRSAEVGFLQIGGGIAGDFPICVVPLIEQDLGQKTPLWGYFCQITDAQESYGGYSGALPNEKITWGKLGVATPKHVVHSDATIVAPLLFHYVLEAAGDRHV